MNGKTEPDVRHLKIFKDRHGKWRIYVRRPGYKRCPLPVPPDFRGDKSTLSNNLDFLAAHHAAMSESLAPLKPGETRAAYGTVTWLVGEYLGSPDFRGRPQSIREKHRRHVEDFRVRRGDRMVAGLEQVHFEKRLVALMQTPAAANQWLDAMKDLMRYAIKRKLIAVNPAADIKRRQSNNPDGHATWESEQVELFRKTHPIGTKARLALELMVRLAFRRSDVIRLGPPDVGRDGVLRYTQFKMRERKPSRVEVPMPDELTAIIRATPGTGLHTWLVDGDGKPFTESAFSHWFGQMCDAAGLPRRQRPSGESVRLCTPHGLRKRCLTDMANRGCNIHEIMAVSGHLSLKEVERYTRMADRARNAREAMRKMNQNGKETESTAKVSNLTV